MEEPSLLKTIITSTGKDGKNAIYIDVHTNKRTVRALIDSGSKLDLIDSVLRWYLSYWVSNPEDLPVVVVSEPTARGHDS